MRTVLVLGAGASVPFGLPTASELKRKVIESPPQEIGYSGFQSQQHKADFLDRLALGGWPSIDAFLSHNSPMSDLGKRYIAATLLPLEQKAVIKKILGDDWHGWLFPKLVKRGTLDLSDTFFVSFNYDRLLEFGLAVMASRSLGAKFDVALDTIRTKSLVHVYGSLMCHESEIRAHRVANGEAPPLHLHSNVSVAASGLLVVPDQRNTSPSASMTNAEAALLRAERVIFLGFGFDELNLARIGISRKSIHWMSVRQQIFASCYGMQTAEITEAKRLIGKPVEFGVSSQDCLAMLRDLVTW